LAKVFEAQHALFSFVAFASPAWTATAKAINDNERMSFFIKETIPIYRLIAIQIFN